MRSGLRWLTLTSIVVLGASAGAQTQPAPPATQPAPAPDKPPAITTPPPRPGTTPSVTTIQPEEEKAEDKGAIGVGVRARFIFLPAAILQLFLDHATSMTQYSIGAAFIRRKGNFDIEFALEYANVSPKAGYYLEKGNNPGVQGQY